MHKLDPNDMDALFREGADKHEFTYNPEAWAMMEEKLDKKTRRKYFLLFFLGAMLIAGLAVIYFSTSSVEQTDPIATISMIDVAGNNVTNDNPVNNEVRIGAKEELKKIDISELTVDQNTNQLKNSSDTNKIDNENKSESKEEYINTISKVRSSDIVAQNSFQSENTGSLVESEVVSVSSPVTTFNSYNNSNVIEKEDKRGLLHNGTKRNVEEAPTNDMENTIRDLLVVEVLENISLGIVVSNDTKQLNLNLKHTPSIESIIVGATSRYVVTALGSSDFSSVGLFSDPQSGFTLGAKVGVQLAHKFQFDLGFAYSLKRYGSEGLDYNIEGGWNTMQGINPTWMDGKGNILQTPLEASYYISGYENNSFFVNAGVSSFLLNSEWYGFKYDPEDLLINPGALEEITMDDIPRKNFHLAGVARVSVGYQRLISPNMAFEISPYLQIPMTGIGEGKVDLYTAGVQFAVKFNTK